VEINELEKKQKILCNLLVPTFKVNHMRNSCKYFGVKCSGDENWGISYKISEALHQLNMLCLPLYLSFFFNMVENQYYLCELHNATLIEKSLGR